MVKICCGCGAKQPDKYIKEGIAKIYAEWKDLDDENKRLQLRYQVQKYQCVYMMKIVILTPDSADQWMICSMLVGFLKVRPTVQQDNNQRMDDDMTHKLVDLLRQIK